MEIKEFLYKINYLGRRKVMVEFVQKGNEAIISIWLCDKIRLEDFIPSSYAEISMTYFPFFTLKEQYIILLEVISFHQMISIYFYLQRQTKNTCMILVGISTSFAQMI